MSKLQFQFPKTGHSRRPAPIVSKEKVLLTLKSTNSVQIVGENSFFASDNEVARFLPCSRNTVRRYNQKGILKKYPVIPGRYIFLKSEVKKALRKNKSLKGLRLKNLSKRNPCHFCKFLNQ